MEYSETRIYKTAENALRMARKAVPLYSCKYSKRTYTQHQHIAVLCIRVLLRQKLRRTEEMLSNMPHLCQLLELKQVPDFSTMSRAMKRLRSKVLAVMLYLSASALPASGKASIDATGFDRRHCSKHYVKRCRMTLGSMKTTFIVDTRSLMILAIHMTATRRHDTRIIVPLATEARKRFGIKIMPGDKGYDDEDKRRMLRSIGIRPLIKHREFGSINKAQNARIDPVEYHRRSLSETVNSMLKRKYDDTLHTIGYHSQCKEILLMVVVHNIERKISLLSFIQLRISTKPKFFKHLL